MGTSGSAAILFVQSSSSFAFQRYVTPSVRQEACADLIQMKGRSLEELDELFEKRVGVFEFKNFRTEIQEKALHDVQVNTGAFLEKGPAVSHVEQPPVRSE